MEGIPSIYWMILIGIFVGFVCFVLYQLGMLLKDTRSIVKGTEKTLIEVNEIVSDVKEMISTVKGTVYFANETVLGPIKKIGAMFSVISGVAEGLTSKREK